MFRYYYKSTSPSLMTISVHNLSQHNISMAMSVFYILYYDKVLLNGQTLCLNKVTFGWTFAKSGRKMSDV